MPCEICGEYGCSLCEDCGIMVHLGASPFCSHKHEYPLTVKKSGFEAYLDQNNFPVDVYITSARQLDNTVKKYGGIIKSHTHAKKWL